MPQHYAPAQKALHWLVVALVVAQATFGVWVRFFTPADEGAAMRLYTLHDGTGFLILLAMLLRLAVRLARGAPPLPRGTPDWDARLAHLNHAALYVVLIVQPLLGWLNNAANGFPWIIYGWFAIPAPIAASKPAAALISNLHLATAIALAVLVAAHLCGVLYHSLLRQDGLLRRMT